MEASINLKSLKQARVSHLIREVLGLLVTLFDKMIRLTIMKEIIIK